MESEKMLDDKQKRTIARRWAQVPTGGQGHVGAFGPTSDYMLRCMSGDPQAKAEGPDWLDRWLVNTFLAQRIPVGESLSLCCTSGIHERRLAGMGVFRHCTGVDISEGAIVRARELAREAGISNIDYLVADLNEFKFEPEKYDVVFTLGALHHIANVEYVVREIHKSLKPGGLLIDHDYIGPDFNDLSARHREIINAAMHLIPPRLRYSTEQNFCPPSMTCPQWKRAVFEAWRLLTLRPTTINFEHRPLNPAWPAPKQWAYKALRALSRSLERKPRCFKFGKLFDISPAAIKAADPSEGVRASAILPAIKAVFSDVTVQYANTSILHYALDTQFYANYNHESAEDRGVLEMLFALETSLLKLGEIPHIRATCVAKKAGA